MGSLSLFLPRVILWEGCIAQGGGGVGNRGIPSSYFHFRSVCVSEAKSIPNWYRQVVSHVYLGPLKGALNGLRRPAVLNGDDQAPLSVGCGHRYLALF